MLLPKIGPDGFTWDTGRYPAIAPVGLAINNECVKSGGSGGFESAGDNDNLLMVIYALNSEFARRVAATPADKPVELDELEASMVLDDDEETEDEADNPPRAKRLKTSIGAPSSLYQVPAGLAATTVSPSLGSGWMLTFHGFKLISGADAVQGLTRFYTSVADQASELLAAATPLVKRLSFTVGSVSLVLAGTDVIYWDWVITFAIAMADSTMQNIPMQFASTIASEWQQNTIKAELVLGGK
ncbi:MAG: hypothetical protein Q9174_004812 [Haloplaca sp. 1 TL-2023]